MTDNDPRTATEQRARVRIVDLPELGAPIADTHAHLDMFDDPAGVLERAAMTGVPLVLTVADLTEVPEGTYDNLNKWRDEADRRLSDWDLEVSAPDVGVVIGVHPHNAKNFYPELEFLFQKLATDPRTVALGEMGLDFYYDHSPRDVQMRLFRAQLALAHNHSLPAVIHLRDAYAEGISVLREMGVPPAGCVVHCFTGDIEVAESLIELGCHISFAGPVTFRKARILDVAAELPLDRIMVETDCPFLAPEPYRGYMNEPALAVLIAARIAEARNMSMHDFAQAVFENTRRVFFRGR